MLNISWGSDVDSGKSRMMKIFEHLNIFMQLAPIY